MGPRLIFYKGFSWFSPDCIYFLAAQHGLQDLSSPKGLNLCPLRCKRRALTTGLPGNSPIVYKMFPLENTQEREEGGERGRKRQRERERERGGRGRGRGAGERKGGEKEGKKGEGPVSVIMLGASQAPKRNRSLRMVLMVFMLLASF